MGSGEVKNWSSVVHREYFAATRQFGRFRREADINWKAGPTNRK